VAVADVVHAKSFGALIVLGVIGATVMAPLVFFTTLSPSTRHKVLSR